jgi:hypothetical protein
VRLLRLLETPSDVAPLAPLILREVTIVFSPDSNLPSCARLP